MVVISGRSSMEWNESVEWLEWLLVPTRILLVR